MNRKVASYQQMGRRRLILIVVTALSVAFFFALDILSGPARLTVAEVISILIHFDSSDNASRTIVWELRLPTALLAILIGGSLGVAGAEMQTILNNPLASPYTLGVSAAASLGAAIALVFGVGAMTLSATFLIPLSAFACALLCSLMIYGIGSLRGGSTDTIIVGGVALHFLFSSGVAFLQFIASEDTLQAIVFWTFGTLQSATWHKVAIVGLVLIATVTILSRRVWQLTALRLGESQSRSLGIDVGRLRLQTLVLVSVLTAVAVCFTGVIGFVGLVAPHLARVMVGEDQRYFLPMSALLGALVVSAAAVVGKTLVPGTIFPIGMITAVVGAPFFASLVVWQRRAFW